MLGRFRDRADVEAPRVEREEGVAVLDVLETLEIERLVLQSVVISWAATSAVEGLSAPSAERTRRTSSAAVA